jgi:hypothetical protein
MGYNGGMVHGGDEMKLKFISLLSIIPKGRKQSGT